MDTIPNEIFALICSYLQPRVLGLLTSCSKRIDHLVKSDTVLAYHKEALYKKWYFSRKIDSFKSTASIFERIKLRINYQNRWKSQSQPSGYLLPIGEDKITTIKCKKNRLLVLSVSEGKATKISVYDLETLKLLATTETQLFRGSAAKIWWKGNDWVLFSYGSALATWNISQNFVEEVKIESRLNFPINFSDFAHFDGHETVVYHNGSFSMERSIYNVRTKETRVIDWIECQSVYIWINFDIRTIIYQKADAKYYMEKYTTDWKRVSSTPLEVLDCYGSIDFKITPDYTFLFYSSQSAPARVFSSRTGAFILRMPVNVNADRTKLKYSKDGMLIHKYKSNNSVVGVYSLKNNRLEQITWITQPYSEKAVFKMITKELALIKYGKSIAFKTATTKTDIVSGAKLTPQISKLVANEYATWRVMDTALSETQIILHVQSQAKQNTIIVLDYCNSVVQ